MDFSTWSTPHTIVLIFVILGFAGQVAVYFYKTGQNTKKIEELTSQFRDEIKSVEERIDRRFTEMNERLISIDNSIKQLNQNHIDHLTQHHIFTADGDRRSV